MTYIITYEYFGADDKGYFGPFNSLEEARTALAERASSEVSDFDSDDLEYWESTGELERTEDYFMLSDGLELQILPHQSAGCDQ